MNEYLKNRKLSFLLASILYLALGLVLLIWPGTATTVICYAFGAVLAIYGLVAIISFFVSRKGGFAFELFLGIVAAFTPLPVIAVPMKTSDLGGLDSLLSMVQMPSGVPVACVAINGAKNAAILAVQMMGTNDEAMLQKVADLKAEMES